MPIPSVGVTSLGAPGALGVQGGVDLSLGSYNQYETLPPLEAQEPDATQAAYNAAGLGQAQPDFGQQSQPPAPQPPAPTDPNGGRDLGTKQQALGEDEPPPENPPEGEGANIEAPQGQGREGEYQSLVELGMVDNAQNRKFFDRGLIAIIDDQKRVWWVDPWNASAEGYGTGIYSPDGMPFNATTGMQLPQNVQTTYDTFRQWRQRDWGGTILGDIQAWFPPGTYRSGDGPLSFNNLFAWAEDKRTGRGFLTLGGHGAIVDGKFYEVVIKNGVSSLGGKTTEEAILQSIVSQIGPGVSPQEATALARAFLSNMKNIESVGKQQGVIPTDRSTGRDGENEGSGDSNNDGIPDELQVDPRPADDDEDKPDKFNEMLNTALATLGTDSSDQDMAAIEQRNRYDSDQAQRKLGQTMAGRGMADSGVAAEMGGQLEGQYARDLAEEFSGVRQKQKQNAAQVAQLLFQDRWQELGFEQQEKMQNLIMKNQKELAIALNELQQGNPGPIQALFQDIWGTIKSIWD